MMPLNNIVLNLSELFLDKYLAYLIKPYRNDDELKKIKKELAEMAEKLSQSVIAHKLSIVKDIMREQVNSLIRENYCLADLTLKLRNRGLFGANNAFNLIFEVGLSWDYLLDLPFMPASSIKGVISTYIESLTCNRIKAEERKSCDPKLLKALDTLFGYSAREGSATSKIIFLDSYPVSVNEKNRIVVPAVITPHYHSRGKPVEFEYEANPVPVVHLVIDKGVKFRLVFGVHKEDISEVASSLKVLANSLGISLGSHNCQGVMSALATLVYKALTLEGVGSRTTKGYGLFDLVGAKLVFPKG